MECPTCSSKLMVNEVLTTHNKINRYIKGFYCKSCDTEWIDKEDKIIIVLPSGATNEIAKKKNEAKGEIEVKLSMELLKEELERGLTEEEIMHKYNKSLKLVRQLRSRMEKKYTSSCETTKAIVKENSSLAIKSVEIEGEVLNYKAQDNIVYLLQDNNSLKVEKTKLTKLASELWQLDKMLAD